VVFGSSLLLAEKDIKFTQYGEQRRLELLEIPLELRVEIHITRVVKEEIQLDIYVAGPSDQRCI
jgi:hypothetical protein